MVQATYNTAYLQSPVSAPVKQPVPKPVQNPAGTQLYGMNAPATPRKPFGGSSYQPPQPYQAPDPMRAAGGTGADSVGGVSAVNPNANAMDYNSLNPFIDSAYNSAMTKLQPQIDQGRDRFDQNMVNRGIPVGSEAYNEAFQQQEGNINDALTNAAFSAMGFGTGIQNQMFGQDLSRSQLANSLLQARMGNQLGYAGLAERGRQFDAGLGEQARQFGAGLGERGRQFDASLGEGARQFDDRSDMAWDMQGFGQMMGLDEAMFRNRAYGDSRSDYQDRLMMALLGMQAPGGQYNYDPNGPYAAQLGHGASGYGTFMSQFVNPFLFGQGGYG